MPIPEDFVVEQGDCSEESVRKNHAQALVMALNAVGKFFPRLDDLQEGMCRKIEELRRTVERSLERQSAEHDRVTEDRGRIEMLIRDMNELGRKVREHQAEHDEAEKDRRDTRKQIGLVILQYVLPPVMFVIGMGALAIAKWGG